jgi:O-antigen/teichoic acid export membrane protein
VKAKELVSDGIQVLAARALSLVGSAGVGILVARALGPDGRGTYAVPAIVASFVATVFAGLATAIASSMLKDDAGRGALRAGILAAIPLVAAGAIVATALTATMHELWAAPYAVGVLPFMAASAIINGYGYGRKNVRAFWSGSPALRQSFGIRGNSRTGTLPYGRFCVTPWRSAQRASCRCSTTGSISTSLPH